MTVQQRCSRRFRYIILMAEMQVPGEMQMPGTAVAIAETRATKVDDAIDFGMTEAGGGFAFCRERGKSGFLGSGPAGPTHKKGEASQLVSAFQA